MADQISSPTAAEFDARTKIARRVLIWALVAVTSLGVTAIAVAIRLDAKDDQRIAYIKDIIGVLLPVISAWVGTILAFYFSRENYVAAAEANTKVLGLTLAQRLQRILAEEVMITIGDAKNDFTLDKPLTKVLLKELLAQTADQTGLNRILIREKAGAVKYIAHRSILDKFIASQALKGNDGAALTLENLVKDSDTESWINSFGTIDRKAPLSDVKLQMDRNPKCSDVVVTEGDSKRVIGWITNVIVAEKCRVSDS